MTDEQIKAVFPSCAIRRYEACRDPVALSTTWQTQWTRPAHIEIELEHGLWNYDQIKALADGFGTTKINFNWQDDPGYSEYTPGGPARMTITVTLP